MAYYLYVVCQLKLSLMAYSKDQQRSIYGKTSGYCHLCHKKLSFCNYGLKGERGSWHFDHDIPRAWGGSDDRSNLLPACIQCNLEKGTKETKSVRKSNGVTRAPYSRSRVERIRDANHLKGVIGGAIAGSVFGPGGALAGMVIGLIIGENETPKK